MTEARCDPKAVVTEDSFPTGSVATDTSTPLPSLAPSPLSASPTPSTSASAPHLLNNGRTVNPNAFQRLSSDPLIPSPFHPLPLVVRLSLTLVCCSLFVGTSPSLLAALRNPELQRIVRQIDAAPDRVERLAEYRQGNADFESFIHQLLQIITADPNASPTASDDDVDLDALLTTLAHSA